MPDATSKRIDEMLAGPDGIRFLIVGGIPGRPYEPWHRTELGAPDPLAG